ncbi:MAG: T9SS type B sorting domain-containing protein [Candidatus Kapabacteria bacterium]|jgi:gliding motility-associated-like protein|nr:T9SS type B sorting domain-containing protein [Candidatus Kapabacteria bacterium]
MIMYYLSYIFLFFCVTVAAQGEGNIWYFGQNAGLDFNTNPPTPLTDMPNSIGTFSGEGCASISDANGNLLFYTNGEKVWNKNHQIMENGSDLFGHNSSTQSSVIIPYPSTYNHTENRYDKYFLVTLDEHANGTNGTRYSIIDMTRNNGLGGVTHDKNIYLFGTTTTEKVCVALHSNGCDYWVIVKGVDNTIFYSYQISSSNGFNTMPVISITNVYTEPGIGQMKISPNNKLISCSVKSENYDGFYVLNFDNTTGILTQKFTDLSSGGYLNDSQYGTSFSPDSKVIYRCDGNRMYQYDATVSTQADFMASKNTFTISSTLGLKSMQLAPDGKIYIAKPGVDNLAVINNPNIIGTGCNFVSNQQDLGGRMSLSGLPNMYNNFKLHNRIIIENENCNSFQVTLENNNNILSYDWGLSYVGNPQTFISTSTVVSPIFSIPDSNENYILTCHIVSECYSDTYQLMFEPSNPDIITPSFALPTYCLNQTPNSLPLTSSEGIVGTWYPNSIDTSSLGVSTYTFTPLQGQCANTIVVDIVINPIENILFADTTICSGENLTFPNTNNISGTWFPANVSNTSSGVYTFTPHDECVLPAQWTVVINPKQFVLFNDITVCYGETIDFPSTNGVNGTWLPANISSTQTTVYTFTPNGDCVQPTTWQVTIMGNHTNLSISVLNNTTIVVNVENADNSLLYQLNNGNLQHSNIFENVNYGCHTVNIIDSNGCSTQSYSVFVFNYPKFFTPNGDGHNDYWNINLENSNTKISIFDRYEKLLKQIHQEEIGWDGTFNGHKLPATDYWFVLEYDACGEQKIFKSHFSLMR